jgi:hypothetical protein
MRRSRGLGDVYKRQGDGGGICFGGVTAVVGDDKATREGQDRNEGAQRDHRYKSGLRVLGQARWGLGKVADGRGRGAAARSGWPGTARVEAILRLY